MKFAFCTELPVTWFGKWRIVLRSRILKVGGQLHFGANLKCTEFSVICQLMRCLLYFSSELGIHLYCIYFIVFNYINFNGDENSHLHSFSIFWSIYFSLLIGGDKNLHWPPSWEPSSTSYQQDVCDIFRNSASTSIIVDRHHTRVPTSAICLCSVNPSWSPSENTSGLSGTFLRFWYNIWR